MKKILIVEDDQIVANIYRNKFSLEGFQVEVANNGPAGLDPTNAVALRSEEPLNETVSQAEAVHAEHSPVAAAN